MQYISELASIKQLLDFLADMPGPDIISAQSAQEREPDLTKPPGSLGKLEYITEWLATWQGRYPPNIETVAVRVFAGNHGVVDRGVSAYPADVTAQMVANFKAGGAAINQICASSGAELQVIEIDLDRPTQDFTIEPAMDETEFLYAIKCGLDAVPKHADLLCIGEMGIGNTTSAAAICMALFGGTAQDWTGPGTGVTGNSYQTKVRTVSDAVQFHSEHLTNGLVTLQILGGRELAGMIGAIIAARINRIPVLLDGFVTGAAAAALEAAQPDALSHCIAAHVSTEPGHRRLLEKIEKPPLLDLGMRLGEASGAALAIGIIKAAVSCHTKMATFSQAGVSNKV